MAHTDVQGVAEAGLGLIETFYDEVFRILDAWALEVSDDLSALRSSWPISDAQLASLVETRSLEILTQQEIPFYGAGYCATERVVAEGNPLAWWQGPEQKPLASSLFGVGPGAVDLRRLEWYRGPELSGDIVVAGPFVDYLCSNEVTLTASRPVTVDDEFVGVLCLDVLVSAFETEFLPKFAGHPHMTVMNDKRRVVVSTDVTLVTGDRVPADRTEGSAAGVAESVKYPFVVVCEEPAAASISQL